MSENKLELLLPCHMNRQSALAYLFQHTHLSIDIDALDHLLFTSCIFISQIHALDRNIENLATKVESLQEDIKELQEVNKSIRIINGEPHVRW